MIIIDTDAPAVTIKFTASEYLLLHNDLPDMVNSALADSSADEYMRDLYASILSKFEKDLQDLDQD